MCPGFRSTGKVNKLSNQDREAYAADKILAHPEVLKDLRSGGPGSLLSVHLMPQNVCNQSCSFCSYRMVGNKNSEVFDDSVTLRWDELVATLHDLKELGVLGVEVTGGGEPLAYPRTKDLWEKLDELEFATAIVTNGTLMRDHAPLLTRRMKWARVSIDCSTKETYAKMRGVSEEQFERAWRAVRELRDHAPDDPEFRLGVGFVLSNENTSEIYDFVHMAKEHGADNVRLSFTFSDDHLGYFDDLDAVDAACEESIRAQNDFGDDSFIVHNLIPTRRWEQEHPTQDYKACYMKDVLCVIEGAGDVFTCCTFTGTTKGKLGNVYEKPFREIWADSQGWRLSMDASEYCKTACLYRNRNLAIRDLVEQKDDPDTHDCLHREFI